MPAFWGQLRRWSEAHPRLASAAWITNGLLACWILWAAYYLTGLSNRFHKIEGPVGENAFMGLSLIVICAPVVLAGWKALRIARPAWSGLKTTAWAFGTYLASGGILLAAGLAVLHGSASLSEILFFLAFWPSLVPAFVICGWISGCAD